MGAMLYPYNLKDRTRIEVKKTQKYWILRCRFFYTERTSKLQKKPSSLHKEHWASQNINNFFILFSECDFGLSNPDADSKK